MLGAEGTMVAQDVPESRDISIFTQPGNPTEVQVMFRVVPMAQLSPPFGAVIVMFCKMLESASLVSVMEGEVTLEILTRA